MIITQDTIAIVSGGASGLGAAAATALAEAGAKLVILDMNDSAGTAHAEALDGLFIKTDVSDPASVAAAMEVVKTTYGAAHIAVNCAGIAPAAKTVSKGAAHDAHVFSRTIQVNLIGTFNVASQAAALMAANAPLDADGSRGVIVNTASVAAYEGQVGQVAYAASKGGVVGMTLPMARDLAQLGIRVCAIAPGLFKTPMLEALPQEVQDSLGAQVPFPSRLGGPAEYAHLVRHIVENPMLNGEVIRLDGAIRMAPR
jgi:NAD(P)-dependent dehydrogenase (short-subunit alcohol dehydrogenase family)